MTERLGGSVHSLSDGFKRLFALLMLVSVMGCIGSSTETDDVGRGGSTETDNYLEVVAVEFKPGAPVDASLMLSKDGTAIEFDEPVTFILAKTDSSAVRSNLYAMVALSTSVVSLETSIIRQDTTTLVYVDDFSMDSGLVAQVFNKDGEPIVGANLHVRNAEWVPGMNNDNQVQNNEWTDSLGMVRMPNLKKREYVLMGESPGGRDLLFFESFSIEASSINQYRPIYARDRQPYSGTVVRRSGMSVDSIRVFIKGTSLDTYTDKDGHFNFGQLPGYVPPLGFEMYPAHLAPDSLAECTVIEFTSSHVLADALLDSSGAELRWTIPDCQ